MLHFIWKRKNTFPGPHLFTHTDFNGMPSSRAEALQKVPHKGKEKQSQAKQMSKGECSWVKKEG